MKKIITLSREFGAGAGEIGVKISKELGFEYYDKELIIQAARTINENPDHIVHLDEKVTMHFGFTQSLFDMYNSPSDERLYNAEKKIIRQIAEKGNCVIVGRNANNILAEYDNTLHVFIHAKTFWRVNRLKKDKMPDVSEDKILAHLKEVDKARIKFCEKYTHTEFGAADNYDISLDSSKLGIDKCVEIICNLARSN